MGFTRELPADSGSGSERFRATAIVLDKSGPDFGFFSLGKENRVHVCTSLAFLDMSRGDAFYDYK